MDMHKKALSITYHLTYHLTLLYSKSQTLTEHEQGFLVVPWQAFTIPRDYQKALTGIKNVLSSMAVTYLLSHSFARLQPAHYKQLDFFKILQTYYACSLSCRRQEREQA